MPEQTIITQTLLPEQSEIECEAVFSSKEQSQIDYLSRLKSYKPWLWSYKPYKDLSPILFARYGWWCIDRDLLQCCECTKYLAAFTPSLSNVQLFIKYAEKLAESLIESHTKTCSMRSAPVAEFLTIPQLDRTGVMELRSNFVQNVSKMLKCEQLSLLADFNPSELISEEQLGQLFQVMKDNDVTASEDDVTMSSIMTLCGWNFEESKSGTQLFCKYCDRNLDVGLFKMNTKKEEQREADDRAPSKKVSRMEPSTRIFHPLKQHHCWCPWLEDDTLPVSIHGHLLDDNSLPRWNILLSLLVNDRNEESVTEKARNLFFEAKTILDEALESIVSNENVEN